MDYYYLFPLLLILFCILVLLWWFSALEYVGGVAGVGSLLAVFFGVRLDLWRRQRERLQKEQQETVEFVQQEIHKVYQGGRIMDPSGKVFAKYCHLFEVTAQPMDVDALTEKLGKLQRGPRTIGLRRPGLLQKLKIDMTYHSNAIEGNPITYNETKIILSGFVGPRRRSLRHVHDIVGHGTAWEQVQQWAAVGPTTVSMDQVKQVHELVLFGSPDGGVFRKDGEIAVLTRTKVLLAMPEETEGAGTAAPGLAVEPFRCPSVGLGRDLPLHLCSDPSISGRQWEDGPTCVQLDFDAARISSHCGSSGSQKAVHGVAFAMGPGRSWPVFSAHGPSLAQVL